MNVLDVSVLAIAAVALLSGIREGLSRSGFGLLAVVAAFLAAAWLYPEKPAGFLAVFVLVILAAGIAASRLGAWFRSSGLTALDRVLGGAFGLTNAALFCVLALVALMAFAPKVPRRYVAHSRFAPYAVNAAYTAADVVPEEMKYRVESSYGELVSLLPPKLRRAAPPLRF